MNYENIVNKHTKVFVQTGFLGYNYRSRSTYDCITKSENNYKSEFLDLVSNSSIRDFQVSGSLDHYISDKSKIKIGGTWLNHRFLPAVKQSKSDVIDEEIFISKDSTISGSELFFYGEFNTKLSDKIYFYPGVNIANYITRTGKTYSYLQPRAKLLYQAANKIQLSIGYTATSQFSHLILNPGLGLPSDLWVPSAELISPQTGNHFSIDGQYSLMEGVTFNLSLFYRTMKNILEYRQPIDLFTGIINGVDLIPIFNLQNDWESELLAGVGRASGIEVGLKKETGKLKALISYTYSRSILRFDDLNEGIDFPSKYDMPHHLNLQINYNLNKGYKLFLQWEFISGRPFSLSTEEFDTFFGIRLLRASGRNNYRLPPFHQLSFNLSKSTHLFGISTDISVGAYNVYNRYNAFYIYAYRNDLLDFPQLRKVSIFPFIPQLNFNFSW